jgi:GNAT superfamily N-acetyltransferase
MGAHALFERAHIDLKNLESRLEGILIQPADHAACIVAELVATTNDSRSNLAGYATMSPEFSTWAARDYLHMDTLFVDEEFRGYGIGQLLVERTKAIASQRGYLEVQWQTPSWNNDAIRFYNRLGATGSTKQRFHLATNDSRTRTHREVLADFSDAWRQRNEEALRTCLHSDATYCPSINVSGAPFIGIEAILRGITTMWETDEGSTATFGPLLETGTSITHTWTYLFPDQHTQQGIDVFSFVDGLIISKNAYRRSPYTWAR